MEQTTIFKGEGCVRRQMPTLSLTKRCLIVTGRGSARKSGALADVTETLDAAGVAWTVFDGIAENPTLLSCREAGRRGSDFGAELVIGIGGGSPLDAC